jgi:hypothetical protein
MLSVFTNGSGESGFDQRLEGIGQWCGVLDAKGSVAQGSAVEWGRGRVECGLGELLFGVVGGWERMTGLDWVS